MGVKRYKGTKSCNGKLEHCYIQQLGTYCWVCRLLGQSSCREKALKNKYTIKSGVSNKT